jgi:hypothetical protein
VTFAFGGQGLFERRVAPQKSGQSIGALFWWLRYSTFSYPRTTETSIAIHRALGDPKGNGAASHLAAKAPGDLWSEKSFAKVSEVAGNSRIKMQGVWKTK